MPTENASATAASLRTCDLPELPSPVVPTAADVVAGPPLSPAKRIWIYDPNEWEEFIWEWAHQIAPKYAHIQRLGGPGDRGMDVAGFLSDQGLEGEWDCFQCKHYEGTLTPSDAWPEITKILRANLDKYCTIPRRYSFFSPRGPGPKLAKLLNSPLALQSAYLEEVQRLDGHAKGTSSTVRNALVSLAKTIDFTVFNAVDLEEVLETHRKTPYHSTRFGSGLPARPAPLLPPDLPMDGENRYVEQLIEVYHEKYRDHSITSSNASTHPQTRIHFPRQREAFYCAESLRVFARDSVPDGTFEKLQDNIYDGVVEVEERDHFNGHERMSRVLEAATQIDLSSNALITVTEPRDKKGICHHLANEDRLTWVQGEAT